MKVEFVRNVLGVFFLMLLSWQAFASPPPPNVVVFILDDVGREDVGAFGNAIVKTPHIDKLAAEGMRFDNAFLTTSSCSPSRASILTGLYPSATGARNLHDSLPAEIVSLPQLLRNAGYYTASVGKWHLGEPFKSHFDRVVEDREESGAADWLPELSRRPTDKPFFFWLSSKDAHEPYYWYPPLLHYSPSAMPVPYYAEDNPFTRQVMAGYYNEITRADYSIGLVLDQLRKQNVIDNTLIIVLSDNGSHIGGAKTSLYDEGLKTPLVLRLPGTILRGSVNLQLVSTVDLMPTILELAHVLPATDVPGVSLLATLSNPKIPVREYIYAEQNKHGQEHFSRVVHTQNYLYKRNYFNRRLCNPMDDAIWDPDIPRDAGHAEFYDLQRDMHAQENRIKDPVYGNNLNAARQTMSTIMAQTQQYIPHLIMEQCDLRPFHERVTWRPEL
jgi:N-sulfoglucosamine sulfohydrolase